MDREAGPASRRRRKPLIVAGCVLALALGGGVVAVVLQDDSVPTPKPVEVIGPDLSPLTLGRLEIGAPPVTDYVRGGNYVRSGEFGFTFGYSDHRAIEPRSYALMDGGYLVEDRYQGAPYAFFVGFDQKKSRQSWYLSGGFAVEAGGATGAFVIPDGTPVVFQDGGQQMFELAPIPAPGPYDAVALSGEDCSGRRTDCALIVRSGSAPARTWLVRADGPAVPANLGVAGAVAVGGDGKVAGIVTAPSAHCSAVADAKRRRLWKNCRARLLDFSPDSRHVLGTTAVAGRPGRDLSVFNAATGRTVLHLRSSPRLAVRQLRWEDREHLLALVREATVDPETGESAGIRWAVLRIALDGNREYAVAPSAEVRFDRSPIVLPAN